VARSNWLVFPLLDEHAQRIRGKDRREAADIALARAKRSWQVDSPGAPEGGQWLVARICQGFRVATVPDPGSLTWMLCGALAGLYWWRRRK